MVKDDPWFILIAAKKLAAPVFTLPIITEEFEPVHLITKSVAVDVALRLPKIFEVIVTPSFGIKNPPAAIADADASFLIVVTVIFVSILTILLFAYTSSDAVGIIEPLHIAALLQLPEDIGHLFGIIKL
jgi:hypothetical protein